MRKHSFIQTRVQPMATTALLLLLLMACAPTTTPVRALADANFLQVQGNQIVTAHGAPVYLRGVNMDTYYYSYTWDPLAAQRYATQADIEYLASLGVNAIRLGLHWRYFDTTLGFDLIDDYLAWCESAGIYVILDMHVVPPEDDILQGEIWDNPAAQQQLIDLWVQIATRYANNTTLAGYDLYNEPAPPTAAEWWALAARIATAIRSADTNHILFVENPLIADNALQLLNDPNVVYSFHDYTPFAVSHASAGWVGDSPVPSDYTYPGDVLESLEWANWAQDAPEFTGQTTQWQQWDSGTLTVPAGVEFATLKPSTWGNTGSVWFDDLQMWHNNQPQSVWNGDLETASNADETQPANWFFWSDTGFTGAWSNQHAHSGTRSLSIVSDGDGYAMWGQSNSIFTAPLIRVQPGDTLQARGWILAPENAGGGINIGFDYLNGIYAHYDRARLQADMQPFIDWGIQNNVPLFVGEFGAMAAAPGDSRPNLVRDKISVMNTANLHWALWTYRDLSPLGFGVYHDTELDETLATVLRQALVKPSAALYLPLIIGQ